MDAVARYISGYPDKIRWMLHLLHETISLYPGIFTKMRYKIPFYYRKSWICYLNVLKAGGIELAFSRANKLVNGYYLLDFKERKPVAGITFHQPKDIDLVLVRMIILEAIELYEDKPYASKRNKISD